MRMILMIAELPANYHEPRILHADGNAYHLRAAHMPATRRGRQKGALFAKTMLQGQLQRRVTYWRPRHEACCILSVKPACGTCFGVRQRTACSKHTTFFTVLRKWQVFGYALVC